MALHVCSLHDVGSDGNLQLIALACLPLVMMACALCVLHCVRASQCASFSVCFLPVYGLCLADMLWCRSRVRALAWKGGPPCLYVPAGDRHWSSHCGGGGGAALSEPDS